MKTLRPFTTLVITAVTFLTVPDALRAAEPISISETQADAQVSGTLPNSRAGLMTLGSLGGLNETTIGALPHFGADGNFGDHVWENDYYRANAFLPWNINPGTDYFFGSVGLGATANSDFLVNTGLGYAYYLENMDRLMRSSLWLDVDDQFSDTIYQVGFSHENLGKFVDVRLDGAFVLSDSVNDVFSGLTGNTIFQGNNLLYEGRTVEEIAYNKMNLEIGGPLPYLGDYGINFYGKSYYIRNSDAEKDSLGWGVRAEWSITEDVTFNVNHTKDDIFENNTWFSVSFTTPDGAPRNFLRPISVRERFSKPVVRDGRAPVERITQTQNVLAVNPKTTEPYYFAHVDPAASSGDGTFESPYGDINELISANDPGSLIDIIYVRPDNTLSGTELEVALGNNLVLNDNQYLLGSTIPHVIPVANGPFGPTVSITPQDSGAALPELTNGNISPRGIVYAADGNTIAGLGFDGGGIHDGIRGDGNSILGDLIDDDVIRMITITDNEFSNTNIGINLGDLSDGDPMPGMPIWSTISRNTFTNNDVAFDVGINTNNNDATDVDTQDRETLTMTMRGNLVTGNEEGGILRSQGPGALLDLQERDLDGDMTVDSVFSGNLFDGNNGNGMSIFVETGGQILADIGALAGTSQDIDQPNIFNQFTNNTGNGLFISVNSSENNVNQINLRNNLFANNELSGASIATGGDAVLVIHGTRNIYMDNILHGLEINSFNNSSIGSPFDYVEPDFALLDADPTGIVFGNADAADPLSVVFPSASTFKGEYFIGNGQDGAHIRAQSAQIAGQVPITNESWHNIAFLFDDGAGDNGNFRNLFLDNGNDGIRIINDSVATVDGNNPIESYYTIRGTEIGNSGQDGIHIELLGAESAAFPEHSVSRYGPNVVTIGGQTLQDRVFTINNGDQGVSVVSNHVDQGTFNGSPNFFSSVSPDFDGVYRPDRFYIDQFSSIQNGGDGFEILVQSSSDVNFNMFRSNMVENGGIGLEMDVNTANDFNTFELDDTQFPSDDVPNNNFTYGLGSVFNIGSDIAGTGNLFQSNALQGVFFQTLSNVPPGNLVNLERVVSGIISNDAMNPVPTQNVQQSLTSGEYASVENVFFRTIGRLNFYDNTVQTNGTQANGADGLALSVGTSTNMVASIAQNTFGGNAGADLNIVNVVSQNPEQSIDNRFGNPNRDELAVDPIGILDLALGINFALPNPPTSGELPSGANPNTGAQFTVNTQGITTALAGRTELGVFTNSDLIKSANRNSFMVINAYGTIPDIDANTWTQSGSTFTTLSNADFFLPDTFNTSGIGGIDPVFRPGLIREGFTTVNFIELTDPGRLFP